MSESRNNHYVPIWYQERFIEPGSKGLVYLDLAPAIHRLPDGRTYTDKARFPNAAPSRCFSQRDLYTTFFGSTVNVEIERMLFGKLDTTGSAATRAIAGTDVGEWTRHFEAFLEYLDAQKLRTPKGLGWLRSRYPTLTQNHLMHEMQAVRLLHCSTWAAGVREIVSAKTADIKFIVSDHPITIYNHALPPGHPECAYPKDPSTALKASQTIYPLDRDHCLIITNLDYANNPNLPDPLGKSLGAKNFRQSVTRTDTFIRSRTLARDEVAEINAIIKARAHRYIAAGREEWLHPESIISSAWAERRKLLLPPRNALHHFGGEIFVKFDDGHVHHQDEFGRSDPPHEGLLKTPLAAPERDQQCPCGSGQRYKKCCSAVPLNLRPSWTELSIRERNLILIRAIADTLGTSSGKDWVGVRKEITDDKIRRVYELFGTLWPRDTDLMNLLPKPDGRPRAIYTGIIDPPAILEFIPAAALYFGPIFIQNPFQHPRHVRPEFSPVQNPQLYRQEFLKSALFMLDLAPFIHRGAVNVFPDPCIFDNHVMRQMFSMAEQRSGPLFRGVELDPRSKWATSQEAARSRLYFPAEFLLRELTEAGKQLSQDQVAALPGFLQRKREQDSFASLQPWQSFPKGRSGLVTVLKTAPNFEITVYIAQATGAYIITDSRMRWLELHRMHEVQTRLGGFHLERFAAALPQQTQHLPLNGAHFAELFHEARFRDHRAVIYSAFQYLMEVEAQGNRPGFENDLATRLSRSQAATLRATRKLKCPKIDTQFHAFIPKGGIGHQTINRLLVTSGIDTYLHRIPMAFLMERPDTRIYDRGLERP